MERRTNRAPLTGVAMKMGDQNFERLEPINRIQKWWEPMHEGRGQKLTDKPSKKILTFSRVVQIFAKYDA